jgi:hypothetical protein
MPLQKLKVIEVKGKKFEVSLSDESALFVTEFEGEQIRSESLKGMISTLQTRMARQKRVNVPFCLWKSDSWSNKPGEVLTGVLVGIHGGNQNLLVKYDGELKVEQFSRNVSQLIDLKKAKQLQQVGDALDAAQKAFDDFIEKNSFNGRDRVREALGEKPEDEDGAA